MHKILLLGYLACFFAHAQNISLQWEKRLIVPERKETTRGIVLTPDGGAAIVTTCKSKTNEAGKEGSNISVIKVDAQGKKQWEQIYGSPGDDVAHIIIRVENGFLIGGAADKKAGGDKKHEGFGEKDFWLIKIDEHGKILWEKIYGGSGIDELRDIEVLPDGYLLGGRTQSDKSGSVSQETYGDFDYWVVKVNKEGEIVWDKRYGGLTGDIFDSIVPCKDGNYLLIGDSGSDENELKKSPNYGDMDFWIVKITPNGEKIWDVSFGGTVGDALNDGIELKEGGYIVGGFSYSGAGGSKATVSLGDADYWLVCFDEKGQKNYERAYGAMNAEYLYSIAQIGENIFIAGGSQVKMQSSMYYWLLLVDDEGKKLWEKEYPNMASEKACYVQVDKKYIWVAGTGTGDSGNHIWLAKFQVKS
ncbi:MAG: hypothetical protein NZ455_15310 [Bacteroidia bacterium]|nr:hypothetical protein [Bacteroidia bacterium]MDW8303129.1 hypothetical protein [Bacteroidia bacterium]